MWGPYPCVGDRCRSRIPVVGQQSRDRSLFYSSSYFLHSFTRPIMIRLCLIKTTKLDTEAIVLDLFLLGITHVHLATADMPGQTPYHRNRAPTVVGRGCSYPCRFSVQAPPRLGNGTAKRSCGDNAMGVDFAALLTDTKPSGNANAF